MREDIPILEVRRRLGIKAWQVPQELGDDSWVIDAKFDPMRIIVSHGEYPNVAGVWIHASISRRDRIPDYQELTMLHAAIWPDGWAYQVFAPPSAHVNIHPRALHLWGTPSGSSLLPDFGSLGTI